MFKKFLRSSSLYWKVAGFYQVAYGGEISHNAVVEIPHNSYQICSLFKLGPIFYLLSLDARNLQLVHQLLHIFVAFGHLALAG